MGHLRGCKCKLFIRTLNDNYRLPRVLVKRLHSPQSLVRRLGGCGMPAAILVMHERGIQSVIAVLVSLPTIVRDDMVWNGGNRLSNPIHDKRNEVLDTFWRHKNPIVKSDDILLLVRQHIYIETAFRSPFTLRSTNWTQIGVSIKWNEERFMEWKRWRRYMALSMIKL